MSARSVSENSNWVKTKQSGSPHALRDFQRHLAEKTRAACLSPAAARRQLGFHAGDQDWLIDLDDAAEIMSMPVVTRVPNTRHWFSGLINHRGNVIGVVDFAAFIGASSAPCRAVNRLIVLSERFSYVCALRVSDVSGLISGLTALPDQIELPEKSEAPAVPVTQWAGPAVRHEGRVWRHLNLRLLLADPGFSDAAHCVDG